MATAAEHLSQESHNRPLEKKAKPYYEVIGRMQEGDDKIEIRRFRAELVGDPGQGEFESKVRLRQLNNGEWKEEEISKCRIVDEEKKDGVDWRRIQFHRPVLQERQKGLEPIRSVHLFEAVEERRNGAWFLQEEKDITSRGKQESALKKAGKLVQLEQRK